MDVKECTAGDRQRLAQRIASERNAKQRDRLRAAALAIDGRMTEEIADTLGRSRRFVQRWAYAYRDGGIDAIKARKQPGAAPRLAPAQRARLEARLDAGPLPSDGVCTLRGADVVKILEKEFGVPYSLSGAYGVLHEIGYSSLNPRARHRKNDPEAMEAFKARAPLLSAKSARLTRRRRSRSGSKTRPASGSRAR